ncbi:MAG: hypothetical protein Q8P24_16370 [Desulfobacterales bacterium]|nr:hypothetical protein [Desulfobacterales bacterium]
MTDRMAAWNILRDLGFVEDASVLSDTMPGLSFNFGKFKLKASLAMNMSFQKVVLFTGVLASKRSVSEIQFEMPQLMRSREQCAAWIAWNLDQCADDKVFQPVQEVAWLSEGRKHQNLLPQYVDLTAYKARPCCLVQRDWLRLALKALRDQISIEDDTALLEVGFEGGVLSFRCGGKVVALPAEGHPWTLRYTVPAGKLRKLPKRLMETQIDISIWDSRLTIGHWCYGGVMEMSGDTPKK